VLLRPRKRLAPTRIEEIAGSLGYWDPAKTLAEMDRAIADYER
jgi:hypothetical protein